ncbi:hypothetical protein, conserved [Eimeria brunetti]|uniref:Uncharacterized protein n=1 Tax=Eimeria brunetti TaxID=51314 RepID=U6LU45_9EIME|nr:hypothetical protein, conserved [Eimeria brunetti]
MGSQCSRALPGTPPARGIHKHFSSAGTELRGQQATPPLPSSSGSGYEDYDSESINSVPLSSSSESGASDGVGPLESQPPWMWNESCFSSSLWHTASREERSVGTTSGKSSRKESRPRSRLLTHSLPDRIDAEDARCRFPLKLPTPITSAAISGNQVQSAASCTSCRGTPQGPSSGQSDGAVSAVSPATPEAQTKLDEPTRKMFLEFYHRNRNEQRRHEQALKAASRVVDGSVASCPAFVSAGILGTIREESPHSPMPASALPWQEAEALAVEALDVFSPDEKYTRLDEFLALVNAIQKEYQSERHRSRAIRGPNRASTFGALQTPPERD